MEHKVIAGPVIRALGELCSELSLEEYIIMLSNLESRTIRSLKELFPNIKSLKPEDVKKANGLMSKQLPSSVYFDLNCAEKEYFGEVLLHDMVSEVGRTIFFDGKLMKPCTSEEELLSRGLTDLLQATFVGEHPQGNFLYVKESSKRGHIYLNMGYLLPENQPHRIQEGFKIFYWKSAVLIHAALESLSEDLFEPELQYGSDDANLVLTRLKP